MAQRNYIQPGPRDESLLTQQARHRSQAIWNAEINEEDQPLRCQRAGLALHIEEVDERIEPYLRTSGFYGVWKIGFWQIDHHLITALVERWRPETHTFHMPGGECTITLQDIAVLTGLPVDGDVVTCRTRYNWVDLCEHLLGDRPPPSQIHGSMVNIRWLRQRFGVIPHDADEVTILQYARAFILQLAGGSVFSDKSGARVSLIFLPLLEHLEDPKPYSWGSAALAWLYQELCNATKPSTQQIGGALQVLQIWAWDRFSCVSPSIESHAPLPDTPLGRRWFQNLQTTIVPTHTLRHLRYQFDRMAIGDIIWEPYTNILHSLPDYCLQGEHMWTARVPLIFFHIIEWHYPDRVLRQFGMRQSIPTPPHDHTSFHNIKLKPIEKNWVDFNQEWIDLWDNRLEYLSFDKTATEPLHYHSVYMKWYRKHTRKWISITGGAVAGACDGMEQIIRLVSNISRENMQQNIQHIEKIGKTILHAFNEEKRMTMIPPTQLAPTAAPTAAPIESDEDEPTESVQLTRRTSQAHPVDDPESYPFTYPTTNFTPDFSTEFNQI